MTHSLSTQQIQDFASDGVIVVRDAIDQQWVKRLLAVADQQLVNPGVWANDGNPQAAQNRNFSDRYLWQQNTEINAFIRESGCAGLAAQAMSSKSARFYFDHLLVKQPGTPVGTPWHQDVPYWPFLGRQICSVWVALTPCDAATSTLEFVRGSHLDGKYYMPKAFNAQNDDNASWIEQGAGDEVPDINANRDQFDIVSYEMAAGDALIFSAWGLHGSSGNDSSTQRRVAFSTRWLGDDTVWHPHAGADPTVTQKDVAVEPGEPPLDDRVFPELWSAS
ncbi:MAG: phytanoyl-CoA dioxygenase family protein [Thiolinea sp.]